VEIEIEMEEEIEEEVGTCIGDAVAFLQLQLHQLLPGARQKPRLY
jgi:hypothetical protein